MAGRPNKPLFELLREESNASRRESLAPARVTTPAPEIKPVPERVSTERAEEWAQPSEPGLYSTTVVQLPVYAIYVTAALALAVSIAAWSIGWQMGVTKAKEDALKAAVAGSPITHEVVRQEPEASKQAEVPKVKPSAGDTGAGVPPLQMKTGAPATGGQGSKAPVVADASRPVLSASGPLAADPREPRLNYLVISHKMPRDDASELIQLLSKNNLEAVGVPVAGVESPGKASKNEGLFKVVAVKGLTKEQYRKDQSRMTMQEIVARVGQQWKDPKQGRTDLSGWYWELLVP